MSILDTTIVNVALQTLREDLGASLATIQWVSTAYLLALASVIPLTGWAAERFGPRRVWMTAVAAFVLTSALCGLAWSAGALIALPRAAGPRRRHDHADRDDHARAGGRARSAWGGR